MIKWTISNIFTAAICCTLLVTNSYAEEFILNDRGFERNAVADGEINPFHPLPTIPNLAECRKACYSRIKCLSFSYCENDREKECVLSRYSFASQKLRKTDIVFPSDQIQAQLDWNADKIDIVRLKIDKSCKIYGKDLMENFEFTNLDAIGNWPAIEVYPVDEIAHCVQLVIEHKVDAFLFLWRDQFHLSGKEPPAEFRKIIEEADKHEDLIRRIYKDRDYESSAKYHRICALHSRNSESKVTFSARLLKTIEFEHGVLRDPSSESADNEVARSLKNRIKMRENNSRYRGDHSLV